jgi:hypothetical protein
LIPTTIPGSFVRSRSGGTATNFGGAQLSSMIANTKQILQNSIKRRIDNRDMALFLLLIAENGKEIGEAQPDNSRPIHAKQKTY